MKFLEPPPLPKEAWDWLEKFNEEVMKLSGSYDAYNQVATPSAGTTGEHPDVCDALGDPGRHRQNQHEFDTKERPVEKLRESRNRQLGSNGIQGN